MAQSLIEKYLPREYVARKRRREKRAKALAGPDRRKAKRITVQELNQIGAEQFKTHYKEVMRKEDRRPAIMKILDILDIPRNIIANVIGSIAGVEKGKLQRGALGMKRVYTSDILNKLGVKPGIGRSIAGFIGDVAIDPLTYATLGATTGTKIAQHLPRILKPGMKALGLAAKGRPSPAVAAAIGAKRFARIQKAGRAVAEGSKGVLAKATPEAIMASAAKLGKPMAFDTAKAMAARATARIAGKAGAKAATKRMLGRGAGVLEKQLIKGAGRGRKGVSAFFKEFGEKGRSIFRLPFAKQGFPITKSGAKARRYKAIVEAIKDPAAWKAYLSKVKDVRVRRGLLAARKAAELKMRGVEGLKAKFEVTPGAEAALMRAMGRKGVVRPPLPSEGAKAARKAMAVAKKGTRKAAKGLTAAKEELRLLTGSPQAPKVIQELQTAIRGKTFVPGAPGLIAKMGAAKRSLFGPGRSEVAQQMVGVRGQRTIGAAFAGGRSAAEMGKQLEPIIARLAKNPRIAAQIGGPDDIRRMISYVIEAGPGGSKLAQHIPGGDEIFQVYEKARQSGLLGDKELQRVLNIFHAGAERTLAAKKAAGIPLGKTQGFFPRHLTKEAGVQAKMKGAAGQAQKFSPERTRWQVYKLPTGQSKRILNTNVADIKKLPAGTKKVSEHPVSMAQWNKWSADPNTAPKGVFPQRTDVERFAGQMFETKPAGAYGTLAAQREQAVAAQNLQRIIEPFGVAIPPGGEKLEKYGHLVRPLVPEAGSPFKTLEATGIFNKGYPAPIADMLNNMSAVWKNSEAIGSMLQATDWTLGFWKTMQLYHPAYVIRNVWQNFFGGLMAGANPLKVAKLSFGTKESKLLRKALKSGDLSILEGVNIRLHGRDMPLLGELSTIGKGYNLTGGGQTYAQIPQTVLARGGAEAIAQRAGQIGKTGYGKVTGGVFRANTWVEDQMRIGTWFHFIDKGMTPKDAAIRVLTAMPDLTDLTLWERNVAKRIMPWWSWMRRNGSLQLFHHLPRKPAYAASMGKLKNFAEGFRGAGNVPEELRPMWMREQMGMQLMGTEEEGKVGLAQTWFPFEEMYQALGLPITPGESMRKVISGLRPGMRFAYELGTGMDPFKQAPFEGGVQIGLSDLIKAFPQAVMGKSGTQMDTLVAYRPFREWAPGGRVAQMPTLGGKAIRAVFGGAMQPVSKRRGLQAEAWRLRQKSIELRRKINRARQVNDEALAQSLIRQWTAVMVQLQRLGLPGAAKSTMQMLTGQGVPAGGQ